MWIALLLLCFVYYPHIVLPIHTPELFHEVSISSKLFKYNLKRLSDQVLTHILIQKRLSFHESGDGSAAAWLQLDLVVFVCLHDPAYG